MPEITSEEAGLLSRLQAMVTGNYAGQPESGALTEVLVAATADVSVLGDLPIDEHTCVFAHQTQVRKVLEHPGQLTGVRLGKGAAAELRMGSFWGTLVEYSVSPFIPVSGPMVVRVAHAGDYGEFLYEADQAHNAGVFGEHLLSPAVMLADECALSGAQRCAASGRRAYVDAEGIRVGMGGGQYTTDSQCRCLDAVVDRPDRLAAAAQRPWLARYLAVLRTVRSVRMRDEHPARVSGFGWRFTPGLEPSAVEMATDPVVIGCGSRHYVAHPESGRLFAVSLTVAQSVEVLGAACAELPEIDRLGSGLGMSSSAARQVLDALRSHELLASAA